MPAHTPLQLLDIYKHTSPTLEVVLHVSAEDLESAQSRTMQQCEVKKRQRGTGKEQDKEDKKEKMGGWAERRGSPWGMETTWPAAPPTPPSLQRRGGTRSPKIGAQLSVKAGALMG